MEHLIAAIPYIILVSSILSWFIIVPKQISVLTNREKVARLREEALKLFLLAEKNDWPGKEKMEWAVKKFKATPLIVLYEDIAQEKVEVFLQKTYSNFMDQLLEDADHLDNKNEALEENINE